MKIEYTLAKKGAERFRNLLSKELFVRALGALTGHQAVQMAQAGLKAIYASGWQVAADANSAGQTYPDQSLYPVDSVPNLVRRINNAFIRADQIQSLKSKKDIHWFVPIIADAEAGFGGALNAFELMKALIESGAAAAHFEDQLASAKKCGHLGGKVLVPVSEFIDKLKAARLAADILETPTVLIARTDANSAQFITSNIDSRDEQFIYGIKTKEGFFNLRGGLDAAIARALAYAPYADMLWCETSKPDLLEAKKFAEAVHKEFPKKWLAYNCSPSFNWKKHLSDQTIAQFQNELGAMGYKFQFVTLAGFHSLNHAMFVLAKGYAESGMSAYVQLQEAEFASEEDGYQAAKHQAFVGTEYFDFIMKSISGEDASTLAMKDSTEKDQF